MADRTQLLLEAERRGILPPEKKPLLDEARNRGLVGEEPGLLERVGKFTSGLESEAIGQGMLFGFGDEVRAAVRTYAPFGKNSRKSYEQNLREVRREEKAFRGRHPVASTAAQIAGGIPTVGGFAKGIATAAPKLTAAIPAYGRAAGTGAAVGGAYGAGAGEGGLEERGRSAGYGAALGAGTGGLAYPLIRGAGKALSMGRSLMEGRLQPEHAARRMLLQSMARDETTPARMAARLRELGPQATLADVGGENVLGTARAVASVPGASRNRAAMALTQRAEGEVGRIGARIRQTLDPSDYYVAEDKFLANLRERARPLYERAYKKGKQITSKKLDSLLNRPVMKTAMRRAAELAQIEGRRVSPLTPELTAQAKQAVAAGKLPAKAVPKGGVGRGVSTEALDDLKRGLDDMIERETNDLTGRLTKRGRALTLLKNQMLREVDKLNPAYAKARAQYSGDAEVLQALRKGREFMRMDPEQIAKQLNGLSDAAKKAYRSGAARAIMDIAEKTGDTASAARRIFGNTLIRKKLRAVMPDQKSYTSLARVLTAEQRFTRTRGTVLGGSPTQPRLAEQADLEARMGNIGAVVGSQSPVGHQLILAGIGRKIASKMAQATPERSKALSRILFSRNPAMNQLALDEVAKQYGGVAARMGGNRALEQAIIRALAEEEGLQAAPRL